MKPPRPNRRSTPIFGRAPPGTTTGLREAHRSARVGWRVAGAGWICAVTGGASLLLLMPLKRVEPFVVRVDNTSGIVDVVPVYAGRCTIDSRDTLFLSHYITVCERFNLATAESDYEECGAFNTRNAIRPGTHCGIRTTRNHR